MNKRRKESPSHDQVLSSHNKVLHLQSAVAKKNPANEMVSPIQKNSFPDPPKLWIVSWVEERSNMAMERSNQAIAHTMDSVPKIKAT